MGMAVILADHEELWEVSRVLPAVSIAIAMVAFAATIVLVRMRRDGAWLRSFAGLLALAGIVAIGVAAVMGIVPRDTSGGYEICGPVLFEPLPAEGENCRPVMSGPRTVFVVTTLTGVALFVASSLAGKRTAAGQSEPMAAPPGTSR